MMPLFKEMLGFKSRVQRYFEILRNLDVNIAELRNLTEARSSETVRNHLAKIGKSQTVEALEFSYYFCFISKILQPVIQQNSASRDTIVCTLALGKDYINLVKPCLDSHAFYCRLKGYDYARLTAGVTRMHRHPSWYKIPLIYQLMQLGYKHVFFVDADAMITNCEISLQPFFDLLREERKTIRVAGDGDGINMGVFFINNTPDALRLLDLLWLFDLGKQNPLWEQAAFKSLLDHYSQIREQLSVTEQARDFNSFPIERSDLLKAVQANNWAPGDFICHFSGIRSADARRLIERYVRDYSIKIGD